ncbi:MAG: undecaprenyl-diphosphate phosphatase [SAR202 cluster bacterium]|nr:undecaprenyl-diphosphate phosphatase [SAR202 cluster bacterium]
MISILHAVILGIIEGVTEFLPISSTGHLIVASELLGFQDTDGTFEIGIQLGAVIAVMWFYRVNLIEHARTLPSNASVRRFWAGIVLAFIPAGIIGYLFSDFFTDNFLNPQVVAVSLIVGGVILWLVEMFPRKAVTHEPNDISIRQAVTVGLIQLFAFIPGMSRSGSTIVGGMLAGLDRKTATAFSFYLAMPTLGGATVYALLKDIDNVLNSALAEILVGIAVSFIVALIAIKWLLRYVSRNSFKLMAAYRVIAGLAILAIFAKL